ncbi:MAG: VTT domain-containing protein [Chloroflexi bacterium]|nr:VTT domain-containing protein [Chloroflexota bacterium]
MSAIRESIRTKPKLWLTTAAVVVLLACGLVLLGSGAKPESLLAFGYPGVFLLMFLSGGATIFPVPGPPAIVAAGAILNPLGVGLAAGLGNATGELVSYSLGTAAAATLENYRDARLVATLRCLFARYGFWLVLAIAAVPNPIFHLISLLAGSNGYPVRRFWLATALGNVVKYTAFAYLGQGALRALFG